MPSIDVAAIANLTLEGVEPDIEKLVITDDTLAGQFKSRASSGYRTASTASSTRSRWRVATRAQ